MITSKGHLCYCMYMHVLQCIILFETIHQKQYVYIVCYVSFQALEIIQKLSQNTYYQALA